jgi:Domain of unknown function (DUF6259)
MNASTVCRQLALSALACTAALFSLGAQQTPGRDQRWIDTPIAKLRLDATSCDLTGVQWKSPQLEVIQESRLGENFRILLPAQHYEANYFNSRDQKATSIDTTDQGVTCHYSSLKNEREEVPLQVSYRIQAVAGQLLFSMDVDNPTDRKLAELYYGILGGLQGVGKRADTRTMVPGLTENLAPQLFTNFHKSVHGGTRFGARYEVSGYTYPGVMPMGWMDVYNPKSGLGYYYGDQDPDTRLSTLYFEMRPYAKAVVEGDDWPSAEELPPEVPVGLTVGWLDFPYTSKGHFIAGPVALQVHQGDWHAASAIYRTWFDRHFDVKRSPNWLRRENAWQSIIISNPEDVIVHRFTELPKLAADAKRYGITTFEILGWDIGGIDRGYPLYQPDPRLGTPEEFRNALKDIRAMGVHPLIFSNVEMADTALPIFRDRFAKYAVTGRWAPDWKPEGWGEGTMGARLGLAQSNMTMVSPWHPEFHKFLMDQYLQLVRDGADGVQLDKTHPIALDFNPLLPTSPDKSLVPGIINIFQDLLQKSHEINPNFAIAAENWTDRAFPYVDVSYVRVGTVDLGSTALRYTFPEWTSTIFAENPGDFNPMNNGMRYGLVWDMAPRHYNESVDEALTRPLAKYVSELIRIRKQYEDLLFLGRFDETFGATVTGPASVRYSVFKSMDTAKQDEAAVIVNFGDKSAPVTVDLGGHTGETATISMPFEKDRNATLPTKLMIPPNRCAVIVWRAAQPR